MCFINPVGIHRDLISSITYSVILVTGMIYTPVLKLAHFNWRCKFEVTIISVQAHEREIKLWALQKREHGYRVYEAWRFMIYKLN